MFLFHPDVDVYIVCTMMLDKDEKASPRERRMLGLRVEGDTFCGYRVQY